MYEILTKEDSNVTFIELLIFTIVTGIVSSVVATYLVRFFDKHKNDRHSPKHGH